MSKFLSTCVALIFIFLLSPISFALAYDNLANNNNLSKSHNADSSDKEVVILLHGILKKSKHMSKIEKMLIDEGYDVINIDYPSTEYTLETLVDIIQVTIDKNMGDKKDRVVHYVGYSMGGLLTRIIIGKYRPSNLGAVILIGTPNHGSEVADFLKNNILFKAIFGPAGGQLTTDNQQTLALLPDNIDYDLGIIAGNFSIEPHLSMMIKGDDDGKVSVESTKVDGMKDHIIISSSHLFLPTNKKVHKQILHFLKNREFKRNN